MKFRCDKTFFILFFMMMVVVYSCRHEPRKPLPQVTPAPQKPIEKKEPPKPVIIRYYGVPLKEDSLINLQEKFTKEQLTVLFALNRADEKHLWRLDSIIVPDTFLSDLKKYSPFPDSLPFLNEVHQIIFFSYLTEAFAAYEKGVLVRWGPTSMGRRKAQTPVGLFHTNWKAKETVSTVNDEWVMEWYFNLDSDEGVSMHEYDLPGYPDSHSCMRLLHDDAYWFYYWAEQWVLNGNKVAAYGTPVVIFGSYPFRHRKPWRALIEDNKAMNISEEQLEEETNKFLPLILKRQAERDSLRKAV